MKKQIYRNIFLNIFLTISILLFNFSSFAYAEELTISNNGDGSQNTVQVTQSQSNTVTQSNQADVKNDVSATADTGGNTANTNNGESTTIVTGGSTTSTNVDNDLNKSQATTSCCPENTSGSITISGNGQGSETQALVNNNSQNNITITQNAEVKNNIVTAANTGNNNASANNGNVTIVTGNINAQAEVRNNTNLASASTGSSNSNISVKIAGNAQESDNKVTVNLNNENKAIINNISLLSNVLNFYLNTGGNSADGNNGDVVIKTGDIFLKVLIENKANISKAIIDCGCLAKVNPPQGGNPPQQKPPKQENPPTNPNPPTTGDDGGGGGNGGGGGGGGGAGGPSVLGASTGPMMPVTGDNLTLGITLLLVLMLILGVYLIRSPRKKHAFVLRYKYNILRLNELKTFR